MSSPVPDPEGAPTTDERVAERLRRLEAITDLNLSRLDVDELVDVLLDRIRDVLATDTAVLLLMDDSGEFLVASYARGLEEEVRQGSRVPLGRGFAGTVAASRRPVRITVAPSTVVNPVLLIKGIRSMLGVPLQVDEELLGVLHVGTLRHRDFTDDDVELLEHAAARAAQAIGAARARADRAAAIALQRSIAPQQLPRVPGLELAARYVPGSVAGVGGDWYDVFALPGGRFGITIGDVMGHGLRAATVMGRLRGALRAYAIEDDDPGSVLERLDREMLHFEPGQTATIVYATLNAEFGEMRFSSAGHMPPVLSEPGRPAAWLDRQQDLLLGAVRNVGRRTTKVSLPESWTLGLFTDGLVERRGADLDAALENVRQLLDEDLPSADAVCAHMMVELIGQNTPEDDVALLVLRRSPQPEPGLGAGV